MRKLLGPQNSPTSNVCSSYLKEGASIIHKEESLFHEASSHVASKQFTYSNQNKQNLVTNLRDIMIPMSWAHGWIPSGDLQQSSCGFLASLHDWTKAVCPSCFFIYLHFIKVSFSNCLPKRPQLDLCSYLFVKHKHQEHLDFE